MKRMLNLALSAITLSGAATLDVRFEAGWILPRIIAQRATAEETTSYLDSLVARARSLLSGDSQDVTLAVKLLEEATKAGSSEGAVALAELYRVGKEVPKDSELAKKLLMGVLATGPSGSAYVALGHLYREKSGSDYDPQAAADAYRSAIDLGNTEAMITLGRMLASGDEIPADFEGARVLFENAIAAGAERDGWADLGALYRDADPPHRDLSKAADALQRASDLGDAWSMISLARMFAAGDGVVKDFDRANKLFEQAIAAGAAREGWAGLGSLFRDSDPPHRDLGKAADALQHASDLGDPWSMIILARMLASGEGVPSDFDKARILLETAAATGQQAVASEGLGDLYWRRSDSRRDPAVALRYYQVAAAAGSGTANLAAGEIESAGYTQDDKRASMVRHFKRAAQALGPEYVAKAMFRLSPAALTAAMKEMLTAAGERPGVVDDSFSKETQSAIDSFCTKRSLAPCESAIITLSLLVALLKT